MTNNTHNSKEENSLRTIGEFDIKPYDISKLRDSSNFFKLESNDSQKAQISNFVGQIPNISGTIALSNAYVVKFPEGVPHTLMQYKDGRNGSAIVGSGGIKSLVAESLMYFRGSFLFAKNTFPFMKRE